MLAMRPAPRFHAPVADRATEQTGQEVLRLRPPGWRPVRTDLIVPRSLRRHLRVRRRPLGLGDDREFGGIHAKPFSRRPGALMFDPPSITLLALIPDDLATVEREV